MIPDEPYAVFTSTAVPVSVVTFDAFTAAKSSHQCSMLLLQHGVVMTTEIASVDVAESPANVDIALFNCRGEAEDMHKSH